MVKSLFHALYIFGFIGLSIVRFVQGRQNRSNIPVAIKESRLDRVLLALNSLGYIILPIIWMITGWLGFADYRVGTAVVIVGFGVYAFAMYIIIRAQIELNHSWTPWLEIFQGHKFVRQGVFKHIRHPIYSAHFLWAFAMPLIIHNWIAGFALLATFVPLYYYRIKKEEAMMLEYFGDEYREYMKHTGRVIPHW